MELNFFKGGATNIYSFNIKIRETNAGNCN